MRENKKNIRVPKDNESETEIPAECFCNFEIKQRFLEARDNTIKINFNASWKRQQCISLKTLFQVQIIY